MEDAFSIKEPDPFTINKKIAYLGEIGRKRQEFCQEYIKRKLGYFEQIRQTQRYMTARAGETISCGAGCVHCCAMFIEATIQECELIVYYLYTHDKTMADFLARYPAWREAIFLGGELYQRCLGCWDRDARQEASTKFKQKVTAAQEAYYAQNLPCPFLSHGLCSIYEVRPYVCAGHVAVGGPDNCRIGSQKKRYSRNAFPEEVMRDTSFYYGKLQSQVVTFMQATVYELLRCGTYYYIAGAPGLEKLDKDFKRDPVVAAFLAKYDTPNRGVEQDERC
jgi:Fe-S-cluster containining protein